MTLSKEWTLPVLSDDRAIILCSYVRPFVPRSGEEVRVNAMLHALAALGAPIYAFLPGDDDATISFGRDLVHVRRGPLPWPRCSRNPWDYWRVNRKLVTAIAALSHEHSLRAVVFDYGFLGQYVGPIHRLGVPVVIDAHNAQADIVRQTPARSLAHRGVLAMTLRLEEWHERHFYPAVDALICVSEKDREYHALFVDPRKIHIIPNFIEAPAKREFSPYERRIIMTGSFTNYQNIEGARWFLEQVSTRELAHQTSFCLAGRGSVEALAGLGQFPNVSALGERDDMHDEIIRSACVVVPILHGSGTRFKCIEALALKTPLVSTSKGVEGLQHEGAVAVADTPDAFRREILSLLQDAHHREEMGIRGYTVFKHNYSLEANVTRLHALFSMF